MYGGVTQELEAPPLVFANNKCTKRQLEYFIN